MHAIARGARRVGAHASLRLALLGALVDVDATIVSGTQRSDHLPLLATYRLP